MSDETLSSTPIKVRWFFGIVGALLIFSILAHYSARIAKESSDFDPDRAKERYAKLDKLRQQDTQALTTADWVDQKKGTVRIPIDEAMTQEIVVLKAKPVQAGGPLPGLTPPVVNNPSPQPAPAQPGAPQTPVPPPKAAAKTAPAAKKTPAKNAVSAVPTPPAKTTE